MLRLALHSPDLVHEDQPRVLCALQRLNTGSLKSFGNFFNPTPCAFSDADAVKIAHGGRSVAGRDNVNRHLAVR